MDLITAFATDDGTTLVDRHFGDAKRYLFYRLSSNNAEALHTIDNSHIDDDEDENELHGDPEKARSIGSLLKPKGAQVLVNLQFGKNIVRMKRQFLPIIVRVTSIDEAISLLQSKWDLVVEEYRKGEERSHLIIKPG